MAEPNYQHSKIHFQMDRLTFFSDAVFAIAITLLVIDLKVPILENATDHDLIVEFNKMFFKFIGFMISFCLVGYYWLVHHRIFGYVEKYTNTMLKYNFFYLFTVVLLPFSSEFTAEYASESGLLFPYWIYVTNICLTALSNILLWVYVSNPERGLLTHWISKRRIRLGLKFSMVVPSVFFFSFFVFMFFPKIGRLLPLLLPVIFVILFKTKRGRKRLPKAAVEHVKLIKSAVS